MESWPHDSAEEQRRKIRSMIDHQRLDKSNIVRRNLTLDNDKSDDIILMRHKDNELKSLLYIDLDNSNEEVTFTSLVKKLKPLEES